MSALPVNFETVSKITDLVQRACKGWLLDAYNLYKINFDETFKGYLERVYDRHSQVKTIIHKSEPKHLHEIFECPRLSFKSKEIINAQNVESILAVSNYIVICGTAGIGKSTLMKHLFLDTISNGSRIPLFVELRNFNQHEGNLFNYLLDTLNRHGTGFMNKHLEYALKKGLFLIMLDGFDEVSKEARRAVLAEISILCDKYPGNALIISSRPDETLATFRDFSVLNTVMMTLDQAVSMVGKIEYDEDIKGKFIAQLKDGLYHRHKSFASNPLLLNIMLMTYDNYAEIPDKLHLFYSQAFETLYSRHDATKDGYKRDMESRLPLDVFKSIFAEFCFKTYMRNQYIFTGDEIWRILGDVKSKSMLDSRLPAISPTWWILYAFCKKMGFTILLPIDPFRNISRLYILKKPMICNMRKYAPIWLMMLTIICLY